ncbi:MAG: hypothetical protein U7123_12865 [Potamolinea sp.]
MTLAPFPRREPCWGLGLTVPHNSRNRCNTHYKQGILEVTIDKQTYDQTFQPLERLYQGGPTIELAVPYSLFPTLNQFPRVLKQQ